MAAPYDTVYQVMYSAMQRLNDRLETLADIGIAQILDNPAAFTQQACNNAWRMVQDFLRDLGYSDLLNETDFLGLPPANPAKPGTFVRLGWDGYDDGTTLHTGTTLPADMISPRDLWERNSQTGGLWLEMDQELNGLPGIQQGQWSRKWEWRTESIWSPGSILETDWRLRYARFLSDFLDNSPTASTPWYGQTVPIVNVQNALAWALCAEFASSRESMAPLVESFRSAALDSAQLVFNRDVRRGTSIYKESEKSKMRDRRSAPLPNGLPPTPLAG